MRAVQVQRFGSPEVLELVELGDPEPAEGEVVIDVAAADVMFLDALLRSGWGKEYFPVQPPYVPGNGVAGRVTRAGAGVDPGWVGTEVITETGPRDPETGAPTAPLGGYAERAVAAAADLLPVPDGVDPHRALALLHDGMTAQIIAREAGFAAGKRVLVAAAAGGAGSLLVQLARGAGARVAGAARGPRKLELATELGAEAAVDYTETGWQRRALDLSGGDGFDIVLDGAGGATGRAAFDTVARGGLFIGYGAGSGAFAEIPAGYARERGVRALSLHDLPRHDAAGRRSLARTALELLRDGWVSPVLGQTYPLEKASEAHRAFAERTTVGKTLLLP
ncbi:zinc-binding dehydrogenase [Haloechinothrix sp. YIM 98757]|uniref:Zinc-binding dehydrogenase n=1 Tax=Haloechinothrix aidingensis TaxID=2752311 RepID=A0A838AF60_9PSEU|nr:zinc-binding dehydrogenase [Haloechinothrix aidingensis]MBA0127787.1 zinc-binding dehydrogenase [Haloechinothrix aidingensis]